MHQRLRRHGSACHWSTELLEHGARPGLDLTRVVASVVSHAVTSGVDRWPLADPAPVDQERPSIGMPGDVTTVTFHPRAARLSPILAPHSVLVWSCGFSISLLTVALGATVRDGARRRRRRRGPSATWHHTARTAPARWSCHGAPGPNSPPRRRCRRRLGSA